MKQLPQLRLKSVESGGRGCGHRSSSYPDLRLFHHTPSIIPSSKMVNNTWMPLSLLSTLMPGMTSPWRFISLHGITGLCTRYSLCLKLSLPAPPHPYFAIWIQLKNYVLQKTCPHPHRRSVAQTMCTHGTLYSLFVLFITFLKAYGSYNHTYTYIHKHMHTIQFISTERSSNLLFF